MTSWSALDDELERWHDDGGAPSLWWRDDDATRGGDALDRPSEGGGGVLPERVAWLTGTVTLAPQEGQANVCPAAVSSTVSFVSHVGHGNFRSIGLNCLRRGGYRNNGFKTTPQYGWQS